MNIMNDIRLATILAGGLTSLAAVPALSASDTAAASWPFMLGGTFCFEVASAAGDFEHLKLSVDPNSLRSPYNIAAVHAIKRGQSQGVNYVDQFSGTATLAPSNDPLVATDVIQVGLTGNGYGVIDALAERPSQIWWFQYNLQLDPNTLSGRMYGADFESAALTDGEPMVGASRAINREVEPLPCSAF